jgi:hypothetical protein
MTDDFRSRLNKINGRLTSDDFLGNKGLGNESGFWVFDYPPEREMEMRSFIDDVLLPGMAKRQPPIRPAVINLFSVIIDLLEDRGLYARVLDIQTKKGDEAALAALRPVIHPVRKRYRQPTRSAPWRHTRPADRGEFPRSAQDHSPVFSTLPYRREKQRLWFDKEHQSPPLRSRGWPGPRRVLSSSRLGQMLRLSGSPREMRGGVRASPLPENCGRAHAPDPA